MLLLSVTAGCGPTIGYTGPERPESETSHIQVRRGSGAYPIRFHRQTIDSIEFSDEGTFSKGGIVVLPGSHSYMTEFELLGYDRDCSSHVRFDSYGYDSCMDKYYNDNGPSCYQSTYETTYTVCARDLHRSQCSGTFTSKAGKNFEISIAGDSNPLKVAVVEAGSAKATGKGKCEPIYTTSETYER